MMPSNRGVFHQASTSFICCSNSASSASPVFSAVGSNWYESAGRAVDTGGWTVESGEGNGAIRVCDVKLENFRRRSGDELGLALRLQMVDVVSGVMRRGRVALIVVRSMISIDSRW